eukprot:jgi/Bigna1/141630/aug1.64_g16338
MALKFLEMIGDKAKFPRGNKLDDTGNSIRLPECARVGGGFNCWRYAHNREVKDWELTEEEEKYYRDNIRSFDGSFVNRGGGGTNPRVIVEEQGQRNERSYAESKAGEGGWIAKLCEETNRVIYTNETTGETRHVRPVGTRVQSTTGVLQKGSSKEGALFAADEEG